MDTALLVSMFSSTTEKMKVATTEKDGCKLACTYIACKAVLEKGVHVIDYSD